MKYRTVVIAVAAVVVIVGGIAVAAEGTAGFPVTSVARSVKIAHYIDRQHPLGRCVAGSAVGYCALSTPHFDRPRFETGYGLTSDQVAGSLGVSSAPVPMNGVTCRSPQLKAGQIYWIYAVGTRYLYTLHQSLHGFAGTITRTSGQLAGFRAYPAQVACETTDE